MKFLPVLSILFVLNYLTAKSVDYLPVPTKDLVKHAYYVLSYNEMYEQANWVYYSLTDSMVLHGGEERSNSFRMDKLVVSGSAKSSDYTKSGYDRGHLCPAADMGFNPIAMQESFLMSNVSPQTPDFNRGIWKELETTVRNWAKKERKIVVVTGPVFKDDKGSIGQEEVLVPGYFFKVIYDTTDDPKLIAFVFPNAKSDRPLTDFAVSINEVEKLTGYDFFSLLPDDLESKLESKVEFAGWFEGYEPASPVAQQSQKDTETFSQDFYFYLVLISVILMVVLLVIVKGRKRR
ncbi:MAG: DNA/RNA non-specific endonuclease [Bacteroidota bacterium]|nr:DNA/RNA non-specific endonuclease [Bacteroidota bacterium]